MHLLEHPHVVWRALVLVCSLVWVLIVSMYPARAFGAVNFSDHTVPGVTPRGTTIDLFDYWLNGRGDPDDQLTGQQEIGINLGHSLFFGKNMGPSVEVPEGQTSAATDDNLNIYVGDRRGPRVGIVENVLGSDGYPTLAVGKTKGESLAYLFDPDYPNSDYRQSFSNVSGLLQVDDQGYYYYDSHKNFAQFNEDTDSFTLYDNWAVNETGNSKQGQFFPFNTADQVFNSDELTPEGTLSPKSIKSINSELNHYFGLSMSTRFVQQEGGQTTTPDGTPIDVTYNFSGDDDVWIFIDGKLVGDLGGNHDAAAITINFRTGRVIVYRDENMNNEYDDGESIYTDTTLKDTLGLSGDTLEDGSYHTLDFYYLERGNYDSNLSLRYNLVAIPESDLVKVDQNSNLLPGAGFEVYNTTDGMEPSADTLICQAVTEDDGSVVLRDNEGYPITVNHLWDEGVRNITLRETQIPAGYRSSGDIELYLKHYDGNQTANQQEATFLLSQDQWNTGVYAEPKVTTSVRGSINYGDGQSVSGNELITQGTLFVVVEKCDANGVWHPVTGNALDGWTVEEGTGSEAALDALRKAMDGESSSAAVFTLGSGGAWQAEIEELPGRLQDYVYFNGSGDGNGTLRGCYYYTTASRDDLASAGAANTYAVTNADSFTREFSARLYVPNILNRVIVQKIDQDGAPINGATMGLFTQNDVTIDEDGGYTLKEGAVPIEGYTGETRTLSKADGDAIDLEGAVIFTGLEDGTYYAAEVNAPGGYERNMRASRITVSSEGVFADAGAAGDGVTVTRGVGRLVRSMVQFATDDDVDATLHDLRAVRMVRDGSDTQWEKVNGADDIHLTFSDAGNAVLDYDAVEGSDRRFTVDEGEPGLAIYQCQEHVTEPRQNLEDRELSPLFTGVTIVSIENRASNVTVPLVGTKTMEGRTFTEGETLSFGIEGTYEGAAGGVNVPYPRNASLNADGSSATLVVTPEAGTTSTTVDFGRITFEQPGTYTYKVWEIAGDDNSVTYDDTVYLVRYEVTQENNVLVASPATITVEGSAEDSAAPTDLVWTNTYNPDKPGEPDKPGKPGEPGEPNNPENPDNPGEMGGPALPGTGDSSWLGIPVLLAAAGFGVVALAVGVRVRRMRK